jgi:Tfp pilus assembly protein PilF
MKKTLLSLIVCLFFIVLLTAVVVNINPETSVLEEFAKSKGFALYKREKHLMNKEKISKMLLQAYSTFELGKIDEAENKLKTILVFEPESSEALSLLGKIYYLQHKYKKAEDIFRQQVKLNKKSASAYNNLGQVLLKQKKCSQAILQFRVAEGLAPESGLIALNLSSAYSQRNKKKESLASFEKAFNILGSDIITMSNHSALDNIREEEEFKNILKKAYKKLSLEAKRKNE